MECIICFHKFNLKEKKPKSLPCGHSLCRECIPKLIKDGTLICPQCRIEHKIEKPDVFSDNFSLCQVLEKINILSEVQDRNGIPEYKQIVHDSRRQSSTSGFVNEAIAGASSALNEVNQTVKKLTSYTGKLENNEELALNIEPIMDTTITAITVKFKETKQGLSDEKKKNLIMQEEGQKVFDLLKSNIESLKKASARREVMDCLDCLDKAQAAADVWGQEVQEHINVDLLHQWLKIKACFKSFNKVLQNLGINHIEFPANEEDYCGKAEGVEDEEGAGIGAVKVTRLLQGNEMELVKSGGIYAAHHNGSKWQSCRVSLNNGHLCVHHLVGTPPPPEANIIPFSDLLNAIDMSNILVFMDLMRPNSVTQRISIKLSQDTPAARWFLKNITGQNGVFKGHNFAGLKDKGWPGECLEGHIIAGNTKLETGLECYVRPNTAGTVAFKKSDRCPTNYTSPSNYSFVIATQDNPCFHQNSAFGQVFEGLEVVLASVGMANQIKIHDCGFMLPC